MALENHKWTKTEMAIETGRYLTAEHKRHVVNCFSLGYFLSEETGVSVTWACIVYWQSWLSF